MLSHACKSDTCRTSLVHSLIAHLRILGGRQFVLLQLCAKVVKMVIFYQSMTVILLQSGHTYPLTMLVEADDQLLALEVARSQLPAVSKRDCAAHMRHVQSSTQHRLSSKGSGFVAACRLPCTHSVASPYKAWLILQMAFFALRP